jgi:hypothetical protein
MRSLPCVASVLILLAGCTSPPAAPTDGPTDASREVADTGSLLVTVVTPDLYAIEGATVTVGTSTTTTDAQGSARFNELPVGLAVIEASKEGFRTATAGAEIKAGEEATARVKLLPGETTPTGPTPGKNATVPGTPLVAGDRNPEQFTLNGYFDCSATYVIITGDCLLVIDTAMEELGRPERPGNTTKEEFVLEFPLDLGWKQVDAEMHWNSSSLLGERMTFAIEPAEAPADGHAAKYARAAGGSPLRLTLRPGVPHPNATASADGQEPDMPNALGGEVLRTRSYVQGLAHNPGGTTFLGAGVALQQRFQVLVTVHYGLMPTGESF